MSRWRYALDVSDEEDYLSRRSLVEFRRRLAAKDPEMKLVRTCVRQHQRFGTYRDSASRPPTSGSILPISSPIYACVAEWPCSPTPLSLFLKSLDKDHLSKVPEAIQAVACP